MENLSNKVITSYRVVGAKAGDKPRQAKVASDTVASLSTAKILYGLNDGEISGIVGNAKGIYLENTPLEDESGNSNFEDVKWDFRAGTIDQEYIEGFPDLSNEIGVGTELKSGTDWIRAINNSALSAVRVRFSWNGLRKTNTENGDVSGYKIEYAIDIKTGSGAYKEALRTNINDKVTGKYERTHRIELPKSSNGWQIRVRRITPNANLDNVIDKMYIEAITEVIDQKFTYPHTTLLGIQYDATTFTSIAKLAVRARGKLIKIPSNYDPVSNTYSGVWNGQFKLAYSDNPAWIFYDLVLSDRYGLGRRIDSSMVDKWALYSISQYCDELVDDGEGGLEKRYSCNVYLQTQEDAYTVLSQLAGIFRGLTYWSGQQLVLSADVPKEPSYTFSRSNVIDGEFEYSGTALNDRHTVAKVAWDNPKENFKTEYEYIRDEEAISHFGINEITISAIGCTSRGQAQRAGLWALKSEQLETEIVSFRTGLEGFNLVVGEVIEVSDSLLAGRENGGRIVATAPDLKSVTVDRDAIVKVNDFISVNAKDGTAQRRKVVSVSGRLVTVLTPFVGVEAGAVWAVSSIDLNTMLFRVMSVKPDEDHVYTVTAIQHEPLKYDAVDNGADVKPTSISILTPNNVEAPATVEVSARYRVVQAQSVATLVIQWSQVKDAVAYSVEWRRNSGNWIKIPNTKNVSAEVDGVYAGDYQVRVKSINAFDVESNYITSSLTPIAGKVGNPKALANLSATGLLFGMALSWSFQAGSEDTNYTEIETATSSSGASSKLLGQFSYPTNKTDLTGLQGGLTVFYRGRIVDKLGNASSWSNWISGTTDDSAEKVLELLEGQITESQLFTDLGTKINQIDINKSAIESIDFTEVNEGIAQAEADIEQAKTDISKAKTDIIAARSKADSAKTLADANKIDLVAINETVGANKTSVDQSITTLTNKDTSLTNLYTALNSEYGTNKAKVTQDLTTLTNKDIALTNSINSLSSTVGSHTSSIGTINSTLASNTQAIANTKSELKADFNSIEIGGRNYSRNFNSWYAYGNAITAISNNGNTVKLTRADTENNTFASNSITRKGKIAFSVTVKTTGITKIYIVGRGNFLSTSHPTLSISSVGFELPNNFNERITIYQDVTDEYTGNCYFGVYGDSPTNSAEFSYPKFEKGTKASDWTAAIEDTDAAIAINSASITNEATVRTNADNALSERITTNLSKADNALGRITTAETTIANHTTSIAQTKTEVAASYKTGSYGKNLFIQQGVSSNVGYLLTGSGGVGDSSVHRYSDYIPVIGNTTYVYHTREGVLHYPRIVAYDSNKNYISGDGLWTGSPPQVTSRGWVTPSNAAFIRVSSDINSGVDIDKWKVEVDKVTPYSMSDIDSNANIINLNLSTATNKEAIATAKTTLTADYKKAIDDIRIGGENLYPNGDWSTDGLAWGTNCTISYVTAFYMKHAEVKATVGGNEIIGIINPLPKRTMNILTGETYTLSWYGIGSGFTSLNYLYVIREDGSNQQLPIAPITTSSSKVLNKVTFVANFSSKECSILFGARAQAVGDYFRVGNVKLEKGNVATEFSPNEQDIKSSIDTVATVSANADTALSNRITTAQSKADSAFSKITTAEGTIASNTQSIANAKTTLTTDFKNYTDSKTKAISVGTDAIKLINPALFSTNTPTSTGYLIIETPITPSRMVNVSISGYNYLGGESTIDLDIGFYNTSSRFYNYDYTSKGSFKIDKVQAAWNGTDKKAVLIIGLSSTVWRYPKITVDSALIGYGSSNESLADGWSMRIDTNISSYTELTDITGVDVHKVLTTNAAAIQTESEARADAVSALASTVTKLQTQTTNNTALHHFDMRMDWQNWTNYVGDGETSTSSTHDSLIIGNNSGNDQQWIIRDENIPLLAGVVYRVTARYWNRYGTGRTYIGVAGVTSNGSTFVNTSGDDSHGSQYYIGSDSTLSGFTEMTGFIAASGTDTKGLENVKVLHANAKYFRPLIIANYSNTSGTTYIDYFKVEVVDSVSTALVEDSKKSVDGLSAQTTLKLDVNGYVSGMGQYNNGTTSQFAVRADNFYIANPSSKTTSIPFQVTTSTTTVNGVSVPAGTYIKDAFIANGSIANAKIGNGAITNAKIGNLAVDTAQIANGAIDNAKIANAAITTAKIGSAQVDTLQIAGEAVTIPRAVSSVLMQIGDNQDGQELEMFRATINASGSAVIVNFGFSQLTVKAETNQYPTIEIAIYRDSTVLHTIRLGYNISFDNGYGTLKRGMEHNYINIPSVIDNPSSGNHTYKVTAKASNLRNEDAFIKGSSLTLFGAKR